MSVSDTGISGEQVGPLRPTVPDLAVGDVPLGAHGIEEGLVVHGQEEVVIGDLAGVSLVGRKIVVKGSPATYTL